MLKRLLISAGALALVSRFVPAAYADPIEPGTTITAIYGTGNGSTDWTASTGGDVTVALQAKDRASGATNNDGTDNVYTFEAGYGVGTRALWSFQYSISDTAGLDDGGTATVDGDTFLLTVDDTTTSQSFSFNPLTFITDNSFGTAATGQGYGTAFTAGDTVAQNSENIGFFPGGNPLSTDTYDITLEAFNGNQEIATTNIVVNVVPDTANTLLLAGLAFGCLIVSSRRFRAVNAV
jgi:hypothetical protein